MPPTISDITEDFPERFITRNRYNDIKKRIERLPYGEYKIEDQNLVCYISDNGRIIKKILIATIHYPNAIDIFNNLREDICDMLCHIENADTENDILIERLSNVKK